MSDVYAEYLIFKQEWGGKNAMTRKTGMWRVESRNHGFLLGMIQWNGQWRQYCFFPEVQTVWSEGCLRDLADFMKSIKSYRVPDFALQKSSAVQELTQKLEGQ